MYGQLSSNDTLFSCSWFIWIRTVGGNNAFVLYYCVPVKTSHNIIWIYTVEGLIKYFIESYYLVMKSTPKVPWDRPLIDIGYKYNSQKVLWLIATEGYGNTDPGYLYLYLFPDTYFHVPIWPVSCIFKIGRYFNACNEICQHKMMQPYDLALEDYWVTQSVYFRLAVIVALDAWITDSKLLIFNDISEQSRDKKVTMIQKCLSIWLWCLIFKYYSRTNIWKSPLKQKIPIYLWSATMWHVCCLP